MKKMYKVRLFKVSQSYRDCDTDCHKTLIEDYTGWEEVDGDTLNKLYDWVSHKNGDSTYKGDQYVLISESETTIPTALKEYLKMIEDDKERERKRQEASAKRKATLAARKRERDIKKAKEVLSKEDNINSEWYIEKGANRAIPHPGSKTI